MTTEIWNLPEIQAGQSQKEVTHNEALREIEAKSVRVLSRTTSAEPGSPAEGDTYIVPAGATGTNWSGQDDNLAHYYGGSWKFYTPGEGWTLWINDEDVPVSYDGAQWINKPANPIYTVSNKTGDYTVLSSENGTIFLFDASGSVDTVTLPSAAGVEPGFNIGIIKIDSANNNVVIDADGADTIEGDASFTIVDQYSGTLLMSDGVDTWYQIGGGGGGIELPILDNNPLLADFDQQNRTIQFDLQNISNATNRVYTAPNKDGTLAMLSDITGGGIASDQFDEDGGTTTGLTWGYQAGKLRVDNVLYDIGAGTVSLADNDTNYVEIDVSTQTVVVNQTGFTSGDIPIREVVTSAGSISTSTDQRAWVVAPPQGSTEFNRVSRSNNANTSITLSSSDANGYIRTTAGTAVTITVPSTTNFTDGDQIHVIQAGAGQITFAEDTGVTVNTAETLKTRKQFSAVTLVYAGTDEWDLIGDLEAV